MTSVCGHPLKALPFGSLSFAALRAQDAVYVDKTDLIFRLASTDDKCFLTRPRGFGKSLLISTLESLFQNGLRDFQGLAIESLWKDKTYPVVRLDFSCLKSYLSRESFVSEFQNVIRRAFLPLGFVYRREQESLLFVDQFKLWLESLPPSSIVVLIDEYDAPLTAHLEDRETFEAVRDCLEPFYSALKEYEGCMRFFFMTGITKLLGSGIFSSFNILRDISLETNYGTLLGFTDEEFRTVFLPYADEAAKVLEVTREEVFGRLREECGGYSFDREARHRVYRPESVLNFLRNPEESPLHNGQTGGHPAAFEEYLSHRASSLPNALSGEHEVPLAHFDLGGLYGEERTEALLTSSGCYSIRSVTPEGTAVLGCPNREAAIFLERLIARNSS